MRKCPYKRKEQGDLRLSPGGEKAMSRLKQRLEPCNAKPGMPGATIKQKSQGNILPQSHRKECAHNNLILYFLVSTPSTEGIHFCFKKPNLYNPRKLMKMDKEFYAEIIFTQCCILNYFSSVIFNNFHITKFDLCLSNSLRYVQRFYTDTLVSPSSLTFYIGIGIHWILSIADSCSSVLEKCCLF